MYPTSSNKQISKVEKEKNIHNDIIQGSFHDSYRNLSYKNVFGLLWVSKFCQNAKFIVKTDDDIYLDLYEIFTLTQQYESHQVKLLSI